MSTTGTRIKQAPAAPVNLAPKTANQAAAAVPPVLDGGRQRLGQLYPAVVSLTGLLIVVWGLASLPAYERPLIFLLLILLAIIAQFASTSGEVTFEVSTAITLAAVPLYGPAAAATVIAAASLGLWLLRRSQQGDWKGSWEQLGFNLGMSSTAVFIAGWVFVGLRELLASQPILAETAPWLIAAVVGDQINIWLLIGVLYLRQQVSPVAFWRKNLWAMPINVIVTAVGGGLLAAAVRQFDLLGVAVFFLPIFLSAYAFRLYVNRMRRQMDRLEELIAERTQELIQANNELSNLHREKDAFLALLTHDMRSPLTAISGYASFLRDRPDIPVEKRRHMMEVILRSKDTLLEIVNNILDIEKLQSGAPILLEREYLDLTSLVGSILELLQSQADDKEIQLVFRSEPCTVYADRQKVERIVQNLASNAIKYTEDEGHVVVTTRANGRYAIIEVADDGYGIPEDELPHIFDRFRRVEKHKHISAGTGLGLAIVKSLVEAHNGELVVESQEGLGSTFTVRLPAHPL